MYNITANDLILDCCCISAPQQVHLTFDSQQYNLGPDGREVIGIIVHVLWCHCIHLFIISSLFGCRNCTFLLSFFRTKCFANLTSDFAPCPMKLLERDGTSRLCWQASKICIVSRYEFQHIPFKWMHHTYPDIVWHLNIYSAPIHTKVIYPIFLQMALNSIWMPSLPIRHWLCIITSLTSLKHISTAPTNTQYHYLLVLLPSKSCCHHGKREVPWLWQVVCLDWTTPDIPQSLLVSDGGTCPPAETCCQMPQLQQWHGPLNRNNSCCFHHWGWKYVCLLAWLPARGAKRQWHIEQEEDNQSNVTFEGIDIIYDFGSMIPSPSGDIDPMEVDLHSRGSISVVHKLEVAAYSNHIMPPPAAEPTPQGVAHPTRQCH